MRNAAELKGTNLSWEDTDKLRALLEVGEGRLHADEFDGLDD